MGKEGLQAYRQGMVTRGMNGTFVSNLGCVLLARCEIHEFVWYKHNFNSIIKKNDRSAER